jgi:chitosanase
LNHESTRIKPEAIKDQRSKVKDQHSAAAGCSRDSRPEAGATNMSFSEKDKLKALAIVHIFETSKAFGDYGACVVLNDGAGVSYGINQFTHRSGSLLEVITAYFRNGGTVGRAAIEEAAPLLRQKGPGAIGELAGNARFKKALKAAALTSEMRAAQHEIAERRYLRPAVEAAEGSGFVLPLSLAVIYDSINHGSYARIRDRVKISKKNYSTAAEFEKAWIYSYVKNRDAWLESVPRLAVTDYRTDFFLAQIARGNWTLELPVNVHGVRLDAVSPESKVQSPKSEEGNPKSKIQNPKFEEVSAVEPLNQPTETLAIPQFSPEILPESPENAHITAQPPDVFGEEEEAKNGGDGEESRKVDAGASSAGGPPALPGGILDRAGEVLDTAGAKFDRVNEVVSGIGQRKDAAKSLWTTIGSTIWQSIWAVVAFIIGLPREVWLTVAVIAGAFMLYYLYRQIALGKIREKQSQVPMVPSPGSLSSSLQNEH